jgi:Ca2+-binding RTX toxin-like protein
MMRTLRRTAAALAATTAALGIATSAASAGTLSSDGSTVTYSAKAGEVNHVNVNQVGNVVTVTDTAGVTLGVGCSGSGSCDLPNGVDKVVVSLGNQDDSIVAVGTDAPMEIDGNAGDDTILGGSVDDDIFGSAGDDTLSGSLGGDHIRGNTGEDTLNGNAGNDVLEGGDGNDTLQTSTGSDDFFGNAGSDTIDSVDGLGGEEVDCGSSLFNDNDFARVDVNDVVRSNCERVQRF